MNKYKILNKLGDGTYGNVYKALNLETNEYVAIKQLKDKIKSWQDCLDMNEVQVFKKLKTHQNIIKLKEIVRDMNSEVYLIFECADYNLYEMMEKAKRNGEVIPESKIRNIIYQLINGLSFIHSNGYFHRDLKPENILIAKDVVKIGDFGLAKQIPPQYQDIPLTDYICTRWYRAPECILKSRKYTQAMDIWALGVIMIELYNLKPIFPGNSEFDQLNKIVDIIGSPIFSEWPEGYQLIQRLGMRFPSSQPKNLEEYVPGSKDAIDLLYQILQWDPKKRPTCQELLNHKYFYSEIVSNNQSNFFKIYSMPLTSHYSSRPTNYGTMESFTNNTWNNKYQNERNYGSFRQNSNHYGNLHKQQNSFSNQLTSAIMNDINYNRIYQNCNNYSSIYDPPANGIFYKKYKY